MRRIFTRRGRCTVYLCDDYMELNSVLRYIQNYEGVELGLENIPLNRENIKWVDIGDPFNPTRVGKIWPCRRVIEVYHGTVFERVFNEYLETTGSNDTSTEKSN